MKNTILYLSLAALIAACGGKPEGSPEVLRKRAERDSLKTVNDEVGKKIKALEDWLTENDTSIKRNLPTVTAFPLKVTPFGHYVDVHGNVKADKAAALTAVQPGRVRGVKVQAGDHVSAGQLLVSVDNDLASKQIAQAEAGYDLAKTTFEKQDALWKQHIGSEMMFLQAKAQKEQAEAGLATLHEQQRLSNITAPFDGTIDEVMLRDGDMVAPGVPVLRIVDLSGVQLEADVPESYLRSVKSGSLVKVSFPSVGVTFDAKVDHVGEYIDPANRTFKVAVRVPKSENYMRPNLLADISILDASTDSALVVPSRAVLEDVTGNSYVFVAEKTKDNEAKARKVMVKRLSEYRGNTSIAPVEAGALKGDETIIDEGGKNVSGGQTVRIANL
jgi:membrane fusion protein (multidrug efflux system)